MCSHVRCAQGPKRQPGGTTGKKWNHGAPLSKKAKVKADSADQEPAAEQRDPQQPRTKLTTVPLPSSVEDIIYPPMAEFFAQREDDI